VDRLNHVKIVTPDPAAVDRFLHEVLDIPEGWPLGEAPAATPGRVSGTALRPDGTLTWESVGDHRGSTEGAGMSGFIAGSPESRQFQIFSGPRAHIWAVAVGTRHLEAAHERCQAEGIPVTEVRVVPWGQGAIRAFFAEVGGIVFEVLRVEPAAGA